MPHDISKTRCGLELDFGGDIFQNYCQTSRFAEICKFWFWTIAGLSNLNQAGGGESTNGHAAITRFHIEFFVNLY